MKNKLWIKFLVVALIIMPFLSMSYNAKAADTVYWTETGPTPLGDKAWGAVASDGDGSNLIAAVGYNWVGGSNPGRIYTSANSGTDWTEIKPTGTFEDKNWSAVASDSDGSNLVATVYGGRLYTYASGSWTERNSTNGLPEDVAWTAVASDSDGSNLVAVANGDSVYTSSDYGVNWYKRDSGNGLPDFSTWQSVSSDSDGSNLIICALFGRVYTSTNGGSTWTEKRPDTIDHDRQWLTVGSDGDGSNLIVGSYGSGGNGRLWMSSDSGSSWTEQKPAGNIDQDWSSVTSDNTGQNLVAASRNGTVWTTDVAGGPSGETWYNNAPTGGIADWIVASDSDGSNIIVGTYGYRLYTGTFSPTPPPPSTLTDISDTMTRLDGNQPSQHTIQFTTPTGIAEGDTIVLTFPSTAPLFNLEYVSASYVTVEGVAPTSVVVSGTNNNIITITAAAGNVVAPDGVADIVIGDGTNGMIINPSTAGAYMVLIDGTFGDTGNFTLPIANDDQVVITGDVNAYIYFDVTDNSSNLGNLVPTASGIDTATMEAATNAAGGYVITAQGDILRSGSDYIPAIGSGVGYHALTFGVAEFGLNLTSSGGSGAPYGDYSHSGTTQYAMTFDVSTPKTVAESTTLSDLTTFTMHYAADVTSDQPAGTYTATHTYICTGHF